MNKNTKNILYAVLIVLIIAAIVVMVIVYKKNKESAPATEASATDSSAVVEQSSSSSGSDPVLVKVEKEITTEMIQEGLKDMGTLLTGEYYFTEVVSYSSAKKLFDIKLGFTETYYLVSYDGVITAGIDCSAITLEKDDEAKTITATIPSSVIQNVDIDPNSFKLYSEKNGFNNPVTVTDFNASLIELENSAKAHAIDKGLLERADANAKELISKFITGLVSDPSYRITIIQK